MKKYYPQNIVFLLITFFSFVFSESHAQTIRIMPLGNSITRGDMCVNGSIYGCVNVADEDAIGYRHLVYHMLDSAKYDIDFVGSESSGGSLMTDTDHAGFSGITSDNLADLMETGTSSHTGFKTVGPYLNTYNPEIIFLHIGTNDVLAGAYDVDGVERILNAVDAYETSTVDSVIVFISTVLSTRDVPCGTDPGVTEFNDNLKALVADRITAGDKLHLLDMECDAGLDYTLDMADEVHPIQTAYNKMGQLWFSYVNAYLHPDIPEAPSDMTFSSVTASSMRVNWIDNSDNEDNFIVERSLSQGNNYVQIGTPTTSYFDDSGLSADVEYFYRVRADNDSGPSGYLTGSQLTLPAPPSVPTNISFTLVTANSMRVGWTDTSSDETHFEVQRSLNGVSGWVDVGGGPTTNYVDDSGLTANTQYFYQVRAVNAGGYSAWLSGSHSTLVSAPSAPTVMTYTLVTANSIRVNWVDNSSNEDNFEIQRSLNGVDGWSNLGEPTVNYYTYSGLAGNTVYYFRVRAVNAGGASAWLTGSHSTLVLPPAAPTVMTFTLVTANSMRVNWVDNSSNEDNFEIQRSLNGVDGWSNLGEPTVNYYVYSGLAENTEYFYRVRAVNAGGNSAWLSGSRTTLLPAPSAPTNMTFTLVTANSMRVNWQDNSSNEDNFEIQRSLNGVDGWANLGEPSVNYYTYSGLAENTVYYFRVRAINDGGASAWLTGSHSTLLLPPAAPTVMTFTLVTGNSMRVNWLDNSSNEDNFEIQRSLNGVDGWTGLGEPTVNYYVYSGLAENTEYFYRVRAVNTSGASTWLTGSRSTLLLAPAAPTNMTFTLITASSMRVNWVDNSLYEDNFEIQRSLTGVSGWTDLGEPTVNYYVNSGLAENTEYFYRVRAVNASGESAWLTGSETTLLLPPDAPSGITFTLVTTSSMRVNWVDNSDNEANFEVQRSLDGVSNWTDVGAPVLNYYDDSGLDEDTEYFYRVRAVNATANSVWTSASQTTLLSIPTAPDQVTGAASDICSVEVKWRDRSDNEDGFEVLRSILSSSSGFVPLQIVPPNTETFTDTDTENNRTYYYRIRVFNDAGEILSSVASVVVSVSLSGGVIGADQEVCPGGDPDRILSSLAPSGGSNNFTYQWQSRVFPAAFSDIPLATGISYDPPAGALFTTEYQRVSTVECGSVLSNTVTITVDDTEAPEFTLCPADTVIEIDRDQTLVSVSPILPVVIDNCDVSGLTWSMSGATSGNSPAIGLNYLNAFDFLLGVTRINYLAEDLMGNSASCSFNVSVELKDPEILNVGIPNGIMKIGDPITATITVAEDGGTVYSLISGSIGGYPLQNFQRINSTTYLANFLVVEGGNSYEAIEDIPVTNLVVSDGLTSSEPYDGIISQNKDLLDAELPVVISADLVIGDYKIGDQVVMNIVCDGTAYLISPLSTMNGIELSDPRIAFSELGLGTYQLIYTVEEGDADVAQNEFTASLIFEKPSGNIGDPHTVIGNTALVSIDANAPVVTRLEVPNEEVGVGGQVVVTITADGTDYTLATGTLINGIPISSELVDFVEIADGLYALTYEVSATDNVVDPGELEMSIIMTDEAGNDGEAFIEVEENELEIYTQLPYTTMVTLPEICEGEQAELIVYLVGREPFSFELFNGEETMLYEDIDTSVYNLLLSPVETTKYSIPLITDRNGVENAGSGSVTVAVNDITPVQITNLQTGYNVEAAPFKLSADVPGGVFSGPGVNSVTGYFDPGSADTIDSPHTIYYRYTNPTGCVSMDSALVFVLAADGDLYIPKALVCDEAAPFDISASNIAGATGSFTLRDSNGNEVAGLTDNGDNTGVIDPALLAAGVYTVEYAYMDGVMLYIRKSFELLFVTQPVILSPSGTSTFCQNRGPVTLLANDPNARFSGNGVSGSVSTGFIFDPAVAPVGETTITCTVSNQAGCVKTATLMVEVNTASEVQFTVNSTCLPLEGGVISFDNQSTSKLAVKTWSWDFGDPLSGAENYSNKINPEHFYQAPGDWSISLSAITFDGCISRYQLDTVFSSSPTTDFTWISDCYTDGQGVEFINLTTGGVTPIESVKWLFMSESGEVFDEVISESITDTVEYQFPAASLYMVGLQSVNQGGCADTAIKTVELRPTVKLSSDGYTEGFDVNTGGWTIESEDENASWVWGTPDFNGYTPGDNGNSWYTDLPAGNSGYLEHSWIQSPCFDFSDMDRPMIKMDIMKSFVPNVNGSVLQYMDKRDEGWHTIGATSAGINWFNSYNIFNQPGGSPVGWGLDVFNPDTDWVSASHDLSSLKGNRFATLRLAIATNGAQGIGNQGFAFDNFMISEKTKLAVLEHFTNSSDAASFAADLVVDSYVKANKSDVVDLQYHTAYPGDDPMNQNNPGAASVRAGNLGVGLVPYAVLDGGASEIYRYDFSDSENSPGDGSVDLISLQIPSFEIDLQVDWTESMLSTSTTVTCMADNYAEYIQLYIVVLETSITAYEGANGDTEFRNVVLKMLPTPAGKLLGQNWYKGVSMSLDNLWVYEPYVEDVADLAVLAFVQDRTTKEILQAAIQYKTTPTGILDRFFELQELQLYPNPAKDYLYINLGSRSELAGVMEVYDLSGRMVMNLETQPGYQIFNLDVQNLTKGMYMIRRIESGVLMGHGKFIKTE